ncbi:DUF2000 domain-containing protein [Serratia sp. AKBS12]|uniref:DUF2000 domain-containing protein n=1 Tax=Serratia sp. AKBS12 TaxID=2974597 RepID=UPI002165D91E|nr:DUF2000 domain-containing protein [Serratia sp. AKBS12]MCS3409288.1 DUF2000 domain-containing protein [Serratia sp. AKBS12]HEI8865613.1 DUF2000 domain-containing protein [Serratia odorifera]
MKFDAAVHKCAIIVDQDLAVGLSMNAVSVIGIGFGKTVENLVGSDVASQDGVNYPGVISVPLPILRAPGAVLLALLSRTEHDDEIYCMPFSALAQSCKTYDDYRERIAAVASEQIELVAIGLIGPKKKINALTGNLPLYR